MFDNVNILFAKIRCICGTIVQAVPVDGSCINCPTCHAELNLMMTDDGKYVPWVWIPEDSIADRKQHAKVIFDVPEFIEWWWKDE